jgi:hypothetical protein
MHNNRESVTDNDNDKAKGDKDDKESVTKTRLGKNY